ATARKGRADRRGGRPVRAGPRRRPDRGDARPRRVGLRHRAAARVGPRGPRRGRAPVPAGGRDPLAHDEPRTRGQPRLPRAQSAVRRDGLPLPEGRAGEAARGDDPRRHRPGGRPPREPREEGPAGAAVGRADRQPARRTGQLLGAHAVRRPPAGAGIRTLPRSQAHRRRRRRQRRRREGVTAMRSRTLVLVLSAAAAATAAIAPAGRLAAQSSDQDHVQKNVFAQLRWQELGPVATGGPLVDIALHPQNRNIWWVAAASGGLWKTSNNGISFQPQFQDAYSISIGDLAVAPSAPDTLYVGTGEANNQRSSYWGNGVYRSTDGGATWTHI